MFCYQGGSNQSPIGELYKIKRKGGLFIDVSLICVHPTPLRLYLISSESHMLHLGNGHLVYMRADELVLLETM